MKFNLLLIVFLSYSLILNAQNIDSRVAAEKNYSKEDTIKLGMQVALAYEFAHKNPDSGLLYAAKAINLATRIKNLNLLGDAYRNQSVCYYWKSDFLTAINSLQQAMNSWQQAYLIWKVAYVHLSIADDYRHLSLFPQAIDHILKSIQYFEQIKFPYGTAWAVENLGLIYMSMGEYDKALFQYLKEKKIIEKATDKNTKGLLPTTFLNIGDAYMHIKNYDSSIIYNKKAADLFRNGNSHALLTNALFNLSFSSRDKGDRIQALKYLKQSLDHSRAVGDSSGVAVTISNMASLFLDFNSVELSKLHLTPVQQYRQAMNYYRRAIDIHMRSSVDHNPIVTLYNFAELYSRIPDSLLSPLNLNKETRLSEQVTKIKEGLQFARKMKLLDRQQEGYQNLSEVYEKQKNYTGALEAYKNFILIRDSISNAVSRKKITQREMQYDFDKKESEFRLKQQLANSKLLQQQLLNKQQDQQLQLANQKNDIQHLAFLKTQAELNNEQLKGQDRERQLTIAKQNQQLQQSKLTIQKNEINAGRLQRNLFIAGCIALLLITFFILRNYFNQRKANKKLIFLNKEVSAEKQKSDELLLNILPEETAAELKLNGYSEARRFDHVTVLFADIVNFTGISERLTPQQLVSELNYCFKSFDEIITNNQLEKIKTIGDAYLAVCGLPAANDYHAHNVVNAAIGIRNFMAEYKMQRQKESKLFFEIRIGINSGLVVAGIVGIKKYAYDIWGDTVNTAARMEQNGEAGKINISNRTYELIKDDFPCTYRGKIAAKNKGEIEMYFIE